jgi:ABC-type transport system substrate-binding protein
VFNNARLAGNALERRADKGPPHVRLGLPTPIVVIGAAALSFFLVACSQKKVSESPPATLRMGVGAAGLFERNTAVVARNIAQEPLLRFQLNGRLSSGIVADWTASKDGLAWRLRLPRANFHGGHPADASAIRRVLESELADVMGPAYEDVRSISVVDGDHLEIALKRPSSFVPEALGLIQVEDPDAPNKGTGPFSVLRDNGTVIEMARNSEYRGGAPAVDRLVLTSYPSVRAAWADLLRGRVDALYEVGADARASLEPSSAVKLYPFQRGFAYLMLFNLRRPALQSAALRTLLNQAIDRQAILDRVFEGRGAIADGGVWPFHWAYSPGLPRFTYRPTPTSSKAPLQLTCIFAEPSLERLATLVQGQLHEVGVDLRLELLANTAVLARMKEGTFDLFLSDFAQGPVMIRSFRFWQTGAPDNYGHYTSKAVDAALDTIRHATDDATYRTGVAAYERAIVDEPPAIFLAWRERARAVSTRFLVPAEPQTDILTTLHLWRPVNDSSGLGEQGSN